MKEVCRKSSDNWTMWQDVRVASPSKAWRFFLFLFLFVSESSSLLFLAPFPEEEILDYRTRVWTKVMRKAGVRKCMLAHTFSDPCHSHHFRSPPSTWHMVRLPVFSRK